MSASCQKIDLPSWPRKDIFSFFSVLDQPFYSVCFRVDVTQLHANVKAHSLSFYYAMTYLVTQAVNEVENLRYTIRDDSVFLLDKRTPSFTELKKGSEQFQIITCPCEGSLEEFCRASKEKSEAHTKT
ncbi:MAG: CatA-like O-acetyltransferase [Oscillospiraceae bacterium]